MTIRIGSNTTSLLVQRNLAEAGNRLSTTFERLSSGQRINRASDDAAGLAISSTLNTKSRIYGQAIKNVNDVISMMSILEGACSQLSSIVTRRKELAEESANGVFSNKQRGALYKEEVELTKELNRIVQSTEFNGIHLLDGNSNGVRTQMGMGVDGSLLVNFGNDLMRAVGDGKYVISSRFNMMGDDYNYVNIDSIGVGDINKDGHQDIFVSAGCGAMNVGDVRVFLGDGKGNFNQQVFHDDNYWSDSQLADAVIANGTSYRIVLSGTGLAIGTVTENEGINLGGGVNGNALASSDINGDSIQEIGIATNLGIQIRDSSGSLYQQSDRVLEISLLLT